MRLSQSTTTNRTGVTTRQSGICFQDRSLPVTLSLTGTVSPPPLLDLIKANSATKGFAMWMEKEKIEDTLADVRAPLTVFALSPTALEILGILMNRTGVLEDSALRTRILLHHFVPSLVPEQALVNNSFLGTLAGPRYVLFLYS